MTKVNMPSQPKRVLRKVGKVLLFGIALVITILVSSHFAWKYSGSKEWKLEVDENGIQVYSLKVPGSALKRFKAVGRVKTTLNRAVAEMISTDLQDCAEWMGSKCEIESLQPWNPQDMSHISFYRINYSSPFSPREFVLKVQVSQDPQSKAVLVEFIAIPDKLPRNKCCLRVENMHNSWRFTPLENGEVEVELQTNVDEGLPYLIVNRNSPRMLHGLFTILEQRYNREKWLRAKLDLVKEK
jgi:START domain